MKGRPLRDISALALLLAVGIIIQGVEALYLPPLIIPGAKLGLANSVTLIMIFLFGWRDVLAHVALRVTAVALVTGTFLSTTYLYSLSGGLISALVMISAYNLWYGRFSYVGISVLGALTHNIVQLTLSVYILGHIGIITLLPWLIFIALVTGTANGTLVNSVGPRLEAARPQAYLS
jgi:heptaprenyl diphosphate synthase